MRCRTELLKIRTFFDRYKYLKLNGFEKKDTFGTERYLKQCLYASPEWRKVRRKILILDNFCDLGISDREIHGKIYVHHMLPITPKDVLEKRDFVVDPEYLITVSFDTHNAIHYGNDKLLQPDDIVERKPYDTSPWRSKEANS